MVADCFRGIKSAVGHSEEYKAVRFPILWATGKSHAVHSTMKGNSSVRWPPPVATTMSAFDNTRMNSAIESADPLTRCRKETPCIKAGKRVRIAESFFQALEQTDQTNNRDQKFAELYAHQWSEHCRGTCWQQPQDHLEQ